MTANACFMRSYLWGTRSDTVDASVRLLQLSLLFILSETTPQKNSQKSPTPHKIRVQVMFFFKGELEPPLSKHLVPRSKNDPYPQ